MNTASLYSPRDHLANHHLDVPVRELMTPGVVSVPEDAPLREVFGAIAAHRVHGVLIVGRAHGTPLGWATAASLLGFLDRDDDLLEARDAIAEAALTVHPSATAAEALSLLSARGARRLLVTGGASGAPVGVLTDLDLVRLAYR